MSVRTCAVIVTYNRKKLLVNCINAVLLQSKHVDAIYIIDNNSNDGTTDELISEGFIEGVLKVYEDCSVSIKNIALTNSKIIEILYVRLNTNTGGAGGFHEGVKRAYETGFDYIWLMDDDGKPDVNCLENLCQHTDKADFIGPLVIDDFNNKSLSFGLYNKKTRSKISSIEQAYYFQKNGIIEGTANPFNGILISNKLVSEIGFPKKEMFIWGDEIEYLSRASKQGFKIITTTNAKHFHPTDRQKANLIFFGKLLFIEPEGNLRKYCYFRNRGYINFRYSKVNLFIDFNKALWFYLIINKLSINNLMKYISYTFDGITSRWGKEKKYIGKL